MKEVFLIVLTIMLFSMFSFMVVNAEYITLLQVADSFNSCDTVAQYKNYNMNWNAKAEENKLVVTVNGDSGEVADVKYILEGNILKGSFNEEESLNGLMVTVVLTDAIGKLHGYQDGELFETLNSETISNYTVENEGFSVTELEDKGYEVKIDISKKLPLADMSEVFVKESDLEGFQKDILQSNDGGSFSGSKGPLRYSVSKYGETIIYIGERDGITERAYNSVVSILDVMDNSKESSEYFKQNYPNISEGDKSFGDYEVSLNASGEDVPDFGENYPVMKVTIGGQDDTIFDDNIEGTLDETTVEDSNSLGNSNVIIYTVIGIVAVAVVIGIVVLVLKRKQN